MGNPTKDTAEGRVSKNDLYKMKRLSDRIFEDKTKNNSKLLENGADLSYIQELLGHKSKKTEIYSDVNNESLKNIKTPFDDLKI